MVRKNGLPFTSVQIKKHQLYFYYITLCWKVRLLTPIIGCHFNTKFEGRRMMFILKKIGIILRSHIKRPLCSDWPFNLIFGHSLIFREFFAYEICAICTVWILKQFTYPDGKVANLLWFCTLFWHEISWRCSTNELFASTGSHKHFTHFPSEID